MKVMIAIDESSSALAALGSAVRLLPLASCEVAVVSVAPPQPTWIPPAPLGILPVDAVLYPDYKEEAAAEAREALRAARERLEAIGIHATYLAGQGVVADELLRIAGEVQPDLIVLGSHGRGPFGRLLMGSVSETVLHRWEGAVLVVRSPEEPTDAVMQSRPQRTVREVMTADPVCAAPHTTLREAARLMREADVGALPVVEAGRPLGIITDRDIVTRALAGDEDLALATVIGHCTRDVLMVGPEMPVDEAARLMESRKVRRLPVVEHGRVMGIVALGDLAESTPHVAEEILIEVSKSAKTLAHRPMGHTRQSH